MSTPQVPGEAREGGCLCGAIRYRVTGKPLTLYACHCTDCQKQSGSAFGMSMMFLKTQLELLQGSPRTFTKTFPDDGRQKYGKFCGDCGVRLWGEASAAPQIAILKPGTLDDTRGLVPVGHIWTRSAQPWVARLCEGLVSEQSGDNMALVRAYAARNNGS